MSRIVILVKRTVEENNTNNNKFSKQKRKCDCLRKINKIKTQTKSQDIDGDNLKSKIKSLLLKNIELGANGSVIEDILDNLYLDINGELSIFSTNDKDVKLNTSDFISPLERMYFILKANQKN